MTRSMQTWLLRIVIAGVIAGAAYFAWQALRPNGLPEGFASGNGRIEATEIDVATKIAGRVEDILVHEGGFGVDQLSTTDRAGTDLFGGSTMTKGGETPRVVGLKNWFRLGATVVCALGDGLAIFAAALLAAIARFEALEQGNTRDLLLVILPSYFLAALVFRSYRLGYLTTPVRSASRALAPLLIAFALTAIAAYAFKVGHNYSRLESGYMAVLAALLLTAWRLLVGSWLSRFDALIKPSVAVLTDEPSQPLHSAATVLDAPRQLKPSLRDNPRFLHDLSKRLHGFDRVVLSFGDFNLRNSWIEIMRRTGLQTEILEPHFSGITPLALGRFAGSPTLVISRGPLSTRERVSKRAFDLAVTLLSAPLLIPLLCLIAVAIKLDSRGPILFVQRRVGQNNRQFNCYKFRTMQSEDADPKGNLSASRDDDRLTRIGRLLRRMSLDELPQLWNVLNGEMSLVGPRPHALGSTAEGQLFWEAAEDYWLRHAIKPGMTGLAQVRGFRGSTQSREELEQRVASDLEYMNSWSFWLDIKILLRTSTVLMHEKAY
jgi:exopolysaccharide biosynthesis polyprenyl glycosylphosphotransferase